MTDRNSGMAPLTSERNLFQKCIKTSAGKREGRQETRSLGCMACPNSGSEVSRAIVMTQVESALGNRMRETCIIIRRRRRLSLELCRALPSRIRYVPPMVFRRYFSCEGAAQWCGFRVRHLRQKSHSPRRRRRSSRLYAPKQALQYPNKWWPLLLAHGKEIKFKRAGQEVLDLGDGGATTSLGLHRLR